MKRIFLVLGALLPSMALSMQSHSPDEARKALQEAYNRHAFHTLKPTTRAFMAQNPNSDEAKILKRYIDEVVKNAMAYRKKDLPLDTISNEFQSALEYTPTDPGRLDYILTGQEPPTDVLYAAMICADTWKRKQKEIEEKITAK